MKQYENVCRKELRMAKQINTVKEIAKLGKRELRLTELNGEQKYDIREWHGDKYEDGARFTEDELRSLVGGAEVIGNKNVVVKNNEYCLSILLNNRTYIRPFATKDEFAKLVEIVTSTNDLANYKPKAKRGRPPKAAEEKTVEDIVEELKDEKKKVIEFPKVKPEIEKLITTGNATYEECVEKLSKEKETYQDSDSQYVLDGVLELCKVDSDFRNNVMREDKTYAGAFEYMAKKAKEGYAYKMGQAYAMDRDTGLGFTIDYFNSKPEEKKPETKKNKKKKGA